MTYPSYEQDKENARHWVLHRLLGHHPTNPNLLSSEVTKDTEDLRYHIEKMLKHRTYVSRIGSYLLTDSKIPSEQYLITELAISIIEGKEVCPHCGLGYYYITKVKEPELERIKKKRFLEN